MKVWLLLEGENYQGGSIEGIYISLELATSAGEEIYGKDGTRKDKDDMPRWKPKIDTHWDWVKIEEYEVIEK